MAKQQSNNPNAIPESLKTVKVIEYVIASNFRDAANFKIEYKAGQPANFEPKRMQTLLELGLVKQL